MYRWLPKRDHSGLFTELSAIPTSYTQYSERRFVCYGAARSQTQTQQELGSESPGAPPNDPNMWSTLKNKQVGFESIFQDFQKWSWFHDHFGKPAKTMLKLGGSGLSAIWRPGAGRVAIFEKMTLFLQKSQKITFPRWVQKHVLCIPTARKMFFMHPNAPQLRFPGFSSAVSGFSQ